MSVELFSRGTNRVTGQWWQYKQSSCVATRIEQLKNYPNIQLCTHSDARHTKINRPIGIAQIFFVCMRVSVSLHGLFVRMKLLMN